VGDQALLVGINKYPGQPLNGCVNDVADMATFLTARCGFAHDDIRLLVDERATTTNIKERLTWLLSNADRGDRLLFHFSGHGALFPVRNAQGDVTAVFDAICPVDFDWTRGHAILSIDFQQIFETIPEGTEFIFVSDSCHSGDLSRALGPRISKFLRPPADIRWRVTTAVSQGTKFASMLTVLPTNCGFISGCKSDQESADAMFAGRANGALTYYLLNALATPKGLRQPLSKLVPEVGKQLRAHGYSQDPQLHGPNSLKTLPFLGLAKGKVARLAKTADRRSNVRDPFAPQGKSPKDTDPMGPWAPPGVLPRDANPMGPWAPPGVLPRDANPMGPWAPSGNLQRGVNTFGLFAEPLGPDSAAFLDPFATPSWQLKSASALPGVPTISHPKPDSESEPEPSRKPRPRPNPRS
jgi:metacaspase-1